MTFSSTLRRPIAALVCILAVAVCAVRAMPVVENSLSNKHITAFVQDADGYIWLGTAKGLYKYNGYEYFHYFHTDNEAGSLPSNMITGLFIDSAGTMWVATDTGGVSMYDPLSDTFRACRYAGNAVSVEFGFIESGGQVYAYGANGVKTINPGTLAVETIESTKGLEINTVVEGADGRLWLGGRYAYGIYRAEPGLTVLGSVYRSHETDTNCSFRLNDGTILFGTNSGIVAIDVHTASPTTDWAPPAVRKAADKLNITFLHGLDDGVILVGTQNEGLHIFDPRKGTLLKSRQSDLFAGVASPHCTACFTSTENTIWLGTFDQGFYTEQPAARRFNADRTLADRFAGKFVTRIAQMAGGELWIGTRYDGLTLYDPVSGKFKAKYDKHNFEPFRNAGGDFIQSMLVDSRGMLWVGYEKKLMRCVISGGGIVSYRVFDIHSDIVSICEDASGRIWTGSSADGFMIYTASGERYELPGQPYIGSNITNIIRLGEGDMLMACYGSGLYMVDTASGRIGNVELPGEVSEIARKCVSLLCTSRGEVWIGSYAKGAARLSADWQTIDILQSLDGGPGSDVVAMAEDSQGCIWMSSSAGLSKFDTDNSALYNFYEHDGTGRNQFHEKAVLNSSGGTIYFGGNHGLTFFRPEAIAIDYQPVRVIIEDLKVLNKSVLPGDGTGILSRRISRTDTIVLGHRNNVFSLDYTGINYSALRNIRYAYILHDFDREWNHVGDFRRASYSNLSPGEYLFEVMAQNPDGVWNPETTRLHIFVRPAPWFHPLAIVGYVLIVLAIVFTFVSLHTRGRINKERIKLVEERRTYENSMNDLKIRFFTNISHELRTPLSLIFGPAKMLLADNNPDNSRYLVKLLNHHADNLLRLVDQIMDFAKLESDTLSLGVSQTDPCLLAAEIVESYSFYAKEKQIEVRLNCGFGGEVCIDSDKYRKIVSNLLSNAIKYTPQGGHVNISVGLAGGVPEDFQVKGISGRYLVTRVADDGIGMSVEEISQLFKRHKRFGARGKITENIPGKGIGLHYVKSLVDIHKGDIRGEQGAYGRGMTFSFILPAGVEAYSAGEIKAAVHCTEGIAVPSPEEAVGPAKTPQEISPAEDSPEYTLLIVEDNTDLLNFVSQIFSREYRVERAVDGAQAIEICRRETVHLIVSDVIMPVMDGLELCAAVKNDPELCHIPIVLLTAKTMIANQIEGFSTGADAYIPKPVDPALLQTVVAGVLANRLRARQSIVNSLGKAHQPFTHPDSGTTYAAALNPLDGKFLEKLYGFMDSNLSDSEQNVNAIGKELGFSRTSFYRKVKILTGYSPNDFLRIYRLRKAESLLANPDFSITEVVDMTGFGTHSYFSRTFKKEFGISPSDFRRRALGERK